MRPIYDDYEYKAGPSTFRWTIVILVVLILLVLLAAFFSTISGCPILEYCGG